MDMRSHLSGIYTINHSTVSKLGRLATVTKASRWNAPQGSAECPFNPMARKLMRTKPPGQLPDER
jgi:hypothetical protein